MAWIIEFRGALSETSELNMDGSTSVRAVSLVYASNLQEAQANLVSYASARGITPTSFIKCVEYTESACSAEPGYSIAEISPALKQLSNTNLAIFTYAISSEAEEA